MSARFGERRSAPLLDLESRPGSVGSGAGDRCVAVCYTLNNPDAFELDAWRAGALVTSGICSYVVGQYEIGDGDARGEGTPHVQGYLQLPARTRVGAAFRGLHAVLARASLICARGTDSQNEAYCTKEDGRIEGPWRFGERLLAGQGVRSDLASAASVALSSGLSAAARAHPSSFVRYHNGLRAYVRTLAGGGDRDWKPYVRVYWGEPDCGKSLRAFAEASRLPGGLFVKMADNKWYDGGRDGIGYCGESSIIIDDFDPKSFSLDHLLKLLDRYQFTAEVKSGSANLRPRDIWITSNHHPRDWYKLLFENQPIKWAALLRRIEVLCEFKSREDLVYEKNLPRDDRSTSELFALIPPCPVLPPIQS